MNDNKYGANTVDLEQGVNHLGPCARAAFDRLKKEHQQMLTFVERIADEHTVGPELRLLAKSIFLEVTSFTAP